jgi:hypothetical protein
MDRSLGQEEAHIGYGDRTWTLKQMNVSRVTGHIFFRHDAEFSAERMSDWLTRRKFFTSSEMASLNGA